MNKQILKDRTKAIRRDLNKKRIGCLVVTKPANVTYTTGFSGDDSWALITRKTVYLLTDGRYAEQARSQCPYCRIIQRTAPMVQALGRLAGRLKSVQTLAVESSISVAALGTLKKNLSCRLRTVANIIELQRARKDKGEISAIRAGTRIAGQALKHAHRCAKPGMTENELAGALDFLIRMLGASTSFETIVAFGPNASRPHHQPGKRRLRENDTILIDFGVRYKNYCCDLTRCFHIGKRSAFYERVYKAVQNAQAAAIGMVKPGAKISEVDAAARQVIREYGLPVYGHGTGHGLGLEVHEEPAISSDNKGKLQTGMVFTIEPAVYIPGKLGVRIEDDVLVTDRGCRVLTSGIPK